MEIVIGEKNTLKKSLSFGVVTAGAETGDFVVVLFVLVVVSVTVSLVGVATSSVDPASLAVVLVVVVVVVAGQESL